MSQLFIRSALYNGDIPLNEEMTTKEKFKEIIDNFISVSERRLKGYSIREIDVLANRAKRVNSEVEKRELLEQIREATNKAQETLNTTKDDNKKTELRLQIQVLNELKSKVSAFNVTEHEKETTDHEVVGSGLRKHIVNLDEY